MSNKRVKKIMKVMNYDIERKSGKIVYFVHSAVSLYKMLSVSIYFPVVLTDNLNYHYFQILAYQSLISVLAQRDRARRNFFIVRLYSKNTLVIFNPNGVKF